MARQEATEGHKRELIIFCVLLMTATENFIEELPSSSSSAASQLTKPDAVSTVPEMVRGDWVLFHPVYSSDELKAVMVCSSLLCIPP